MGAPEADIFLATAGTDADVVVKLIDIYPDDIPEGADQGGKPSMNTSVLGMTCFQLSRFSFTRPSQDPK